MFVVMWNYMGWELPAAAGDEVVNPKQNISARDGDCAGCCDSDLFTAVHWLVCMAAQVKMAAISVGH